MEIGYLNNGGIEKVVLASVVKNRQDELFILDYLNELEFLALTAGASCEKRFIQKLDNPHPRTYLGEGKVEEVRLFVEENDISGVIFDDELSPSQMRNLEKLLKVKIIDRTSLILDIFAQRATTAYAKTQVELAQCKYLLPRLTGMWTHLERQRGGIGMRGPGESEIETDRRIIRTKISKLKEQLALIDRQMTTQRSNRGDMVRVALTGYTNVGKSTLMNLLCKESIFAENKLFATLDTTVRKLVIENIPLLISDTVGFIRKLPHHLVESFKSTLDEVREADVIIHVVDISHICYQEQLNVVEETLKELGVGDKPTILVFNKVDNFKYIKKDEDDLSEVLRENLSLEDIKAMWLEKSNGNTIFISSKEKINIEAFRELLYRNVREIHKVRYPHNNYLY